MGTTSTFLKKRVSKPTLGKWSSGFSAVKKYSEDNNVPLIAVWSNGDACGHCVNFEKSVQETVFTSWQSSSKCVFWFGCSSDTSKDDKLQGTGFTWTRNGKLTTYPFCRVYWKAGKVDEYKSGSDWTGGSAKGGATFVKKLKELLKNYKPGTAATTTTTTTDDSCSGGSCTTTCENCGTGNCDELKKQIENLTAANEKLQKGIETIKTKWSVLLEDVEELEKAIGSV